MLTLSLTRHPHARKELLLERSLRIVSRSGLNPTERALIEHLPDLKGKAVSPLFLGGRTGALAMALWLRGQAEGELVLHTIDAHTAAIFERNLTENHAPRLAGAGFRVSTSCHLEAEPAQTVFWQMTKGDAPAELQLMFLEQLLTRVGRTFRIAAEEMNETFLKRFKKACRKVSLRKEGELVLLSGEVGEALTELPNHCATFEVSLKTTAPITLETLPGCFCHRRADMGGLALTEVVAEQITFDTGDRVMDMGCGCGMDGILLATAFPEKRLHIDYQDSNAAARECTQANLARYPHVSRFFFSAEGEGEAQSYDLFLANPPYFGDWRIATFFIETAARLLKRGGLLAFVSKREAKPLELMQAAGFTPLDTFARRGYTVLLATRK